MSFLERILGGRSNALYREGMRAFNAGRHEAALDLFRRALDCGGDPRDPLQALSRFYAAEAAMQLGKLLLQEGSFDRALPLLECALEWNPRHPALRYLAAVAYAGCGAREPGARCLRAVLAEVPEHREARLLLAGLAHAGGSSDEARQLLAGLRPGGTLPPFLQRLLEPLSQDFPELTSLLRDFVASGRRGGG